MERNSILVQVCIARKDNILGQLDSAACRVPSLCQLLHGPQNHNLLLISVSSLPYILSSPHHHHQVSGLQPQVSSYNNYFIGLNIEIILGG